MRDNEARGLAESAHAAARATAELMEVHIEETTDKLREIADGLNRELAAALIRMEALERRMKSLESSWQSQAGAVMSYAEQMDDLKEDLSSLGTLLAGFGKPKENNGNTG